MKRGLHEYPCRTDSDSFEPSTGKHDYTVAVPQVAVFHDEVRVRNWALITSLLYLILPAALLVPILLGIERGISPNGELLWLSTLMAALVVTAAVFRARSRRDDLAQPVLLTSDKEFVVRGETIQWLDIPGIEAVEGCTGDELRLVAAPSRRAQLEQLASWMLEEQNLTPESVPRGNDPRHLLANLA